MTHTQPTNESETMTIKHTPTVEKYVHQVMDIRGAIENLKEFADSLPAPDENEDLRGIDYGHIGTLDEIHSAITQAMEWADQFSGN